MKKFKITVHVFRRRDVLNPEEKPVALALHNLKFDAVTGIQMGQCFILSLDAESEAKAREQVTEMCNKLLVNLVTSRFEIAETKEVEASVPVPATT